MSARRSTRYADAANATTGVAAAKDDVRVVNGHRDDDSFDVVALIVHLMLHDQRCADAGRHSSRWRVIVSKTDR